MFADVTIAILSSATYTLAWILGRNLISILGKVFTISQIAKTSVAPLKRVSRDRSVRSKNESWFASPLFDLIERILLHGSFPIYGEEITKDEDACPIKKSKCCVQGDRKNSIIIFPLTLKLSI